ncbi:hypothetical protein [Stenotrophomonas rhizophila]|uniref:hypothetical protein n=1 Tax=Stenotrophomonas rhizophila TaxID=216778 RepID=UPI001E3EF1C7|nr:hypothetical protein [Stenotrophomonas rhizophila]MCC7632553.1 hypothetical protein [Stenotrophomonas rhizophila]MCC7663405.1 hypothetical protein [Stenotrophomonas rhizophila]
MKYHTTLRQITAPWPLPACKAKHVARLMEDRRRPSAGGGHFIECLCGHTQKHPSPHLALQEWTRVYGRAVQVAPTASNVVQLGLGLGDRSTG